MLPLLAFAPVHYPANANLLYVYLCGRILDERSNPLAGPAIILSYGNIGQNTNADGSYSFVHLCDGSYTGDVIIPIKKYKQLVICYKQKT
jgi:hypothetical protein